MNKRNNILLRNSFAFLSMLIFVLLFSTRWGFCYDVTIRVGLLMDQYAVNFKCSSGLTVKDAYTMKDVANSPEKLVIKIHDGSLFVDKTRASSEFLYVMTKDYQTPIYVNGSPYRGYFLVGFNKNKRLMVINHVGLEDYLAGVLGGEMPAGFPAEAQKAQAVAARTYVLYKVQNPSNKYYDVVNDTGDQMYLGIDGESENSRNAVKSTRSQVLADKGEIICAYYHSCCGGYTTDSENVFQTDVIHGVQCPYCAGSPNSTWQQNYESQTIQWRLKNAGYDVGKIFSIKLSSKDKGGRSIYLDIIHENGTLHIQSSEFRRVLGYRDLKSTFFSITPQKYISYRYTKKIATSRSGGTVNGKEIITTDYKVINEDTQIPTVFSFYGKGWGHGVGMCQWGARGMAKSGADYKQILNFYYPCIEICTVKSKN